MKKRSLRGLGQGPLTPAEHEKFLSNYAAALREQVRGFDVVERRYRNSASRGNCRNAMLDWGDMVSIKNTFLELRQMPPLSPEMNALRNEFKEYETHMAKATRGHQIAVFKNCMLPGLENRKPFGRSPKKKTKVKR